MWRKLALVAFLAWSASAQRTISDATSGPWTAELNGTWLWHEGDDMQWASAAFDDSRWSRVNIPGTPPAALRYWVRIPVQLGKISDPAIMVGPIAHAYEAYWDGQRIGQLSAGPPHNAWFAVRPLVFHIPLRLAQAGRHVIAFRVFDSQYKGDWTRPAQISPLENRVGSATALAEGSSS